MRIVRENRIDYFLDNQKSGFFPLLKSTQKWKEFFTDKSSYIAVVVAFVMIFIFGFLYRTTEIEVFNNIIQNLMGIIIGSLVGLLGFIISGMAIFTGTITNKLVSNIDADGKAHSLVGILYSFYFVGAVIGIAIVLFTIMYVFSYSILPVSLLAIIIIAGGLSYLFTWIIFYSVSLLGTCLKLFLVSYKYYDKNE